MTKTEPQRTFISATGRDWFLPLYDPITKMLGIDPVRRALVEKADFHPNHRVLDIGCGTGGLVVLIKQPEPDLMNYEGPSLLARLHHAVR